MPNVNTYQPQPVFVEGRDMRFREWELWNRAAEQRNKQHKQASDPE